MCVYISFSDYFDVSDYLVALSTISLNTGDLINNNDIKIPSKSCENTKLAYNLAASIQETWAPSSRTVRWGSMQGFSINYTDFLYVSSLDASNLFKSWK